MINETLNRNTTFADVIQSLGTLGLILFAGWYMVSQLNIGFGLW